MLCDIVDMGNCHILLGRPWQHDCRDMHNFVKNVFVVVKGDMNFSLLPLQNEELDRSNPSFGSRVGKF